MTSAIGRFLSVRPVALKQTILVAAPSIFRRLQHTQEGSAFVEALHPSSSSSGPADVPAVPASAAASEPDPPPSEPEKPADYVKRRAKRFEDRLARRLQGDAAAAPLVHPPVKDLEDLPPFDPTRNLGHSYTNKVGLQAKFEEVASARKAWLDNEAEFLLQFQSRLRKRPLSGFIVFRRDLKLKADPTIPASLQLAEMGKRAADQWGVLSEEEKEVYRARGRKVFDEQNESLRALKASYTPGERWWLQRYLTQGRYHRRVKRELASLESLEDPPSEEARLTPRRQAALARVRPTADVMAQKAQSLSPWRTFLARWRASHPRPANTKHAKWFAATVKSASAAWKIERALEKAIAAELDADYAEKQSFAQAAKRAAAEARLAARRAAEQVELSKLRAKKGSLLVDVRKRANNAPTDAVGEAAGSVGDERSAS